jgi:adenosylhomocysteine nucleosidase
MAAVAAGETSAPPVLLQGALDNELEPLISALEGRSEKQIASWTFWEGRIGAKRAIVSRTEMGPINAVAATVLGIEHFKPSLVINQGTAGAHNPALHLWDIVIGERTVDYSAYSSAHADAGRGVDPSRWKADPHRLRLDGKEVTAFDNFRGDARTIEVAARVRNPRGRVVRGTIGSAAQWNRELDMIASDRARYGTDSEDMESAFADGAAVGLRTRFLAIRMISDSEYSHPNFERVAGRYCAEFVVEVVRRL